MDAEKLGLSHSLPLLRGVLPIDTNKLVSDITAGVTLAALGIPEVMGYTKISGTPIVTGLYTLLLPVIAFALLGGSRHLVVAADSATAAILASMLVGIAALGSPEYVSATSLVALVVAGMLVLARVFKLGFLADFLSRSVLLPSHRRAECCDCASLRYALRREIFGQL
jgi:MFS superfamily sulfate permease-like transporter